MVAQVLEPLLISIPDIKVFDTASVPTPVKKAEVVNLDVQGAGNIVRPSLLAIFAGSRMCASRLVYWYIGNMNREREHLIVERVQTGVRMEKRLLKVLKGLAELKDMTLGDLLEGIVLHAFEGKAPFSPDTLKEIEKLCSIYRLTLKAADSHQLEERRRT
jgi:hypothetical protein